MASPFPGMDPYLEPHWRDVHLHLISELIGALNTRLPEGLVARAEERVAIESDEDMYSGVVAPDVGVFAPSNADPAEGAAGMVIEAPYKLVVEAEPVPERFIRIIRSGGDLVTVMEVLSPTNKREPGLSTFRTRRRRQLAAGTHVVEIDLLRAGDWRALMLPELAPEEASSLYRVTVRTGAPHWGGYLFPFGLREPLPTIAVPLRAPHAAVQLELQSVLETVYAKGRYAHTLDYTRPLEPPLSDGDATWLAGRLGGSADRTGGAEG